VNTKSYSNNSSFFVPSLLSCSLWLLIWNSPWRSVCRNLLYVSKYRNRFPSVTSYISFHAPKTLLMISFGTFYFLDFLANLLQYHFSRARNFSASFCTAINQWFLPYLCAENYHMFTASTVELMLLMPKHIRLWSYIDLLPYLFVRIGKHRR
jgi:hypothetical protein